jgi:hypothetical protein
LRRVLASGLSFGCWCGKVVIANSRGAKALSPGWGRSCIISAALERSFRWARFAKLAWSGLKLSGHVILPDSACADLGVDVNIDRQRTGRAPGRSENEGCSTAAVSVSAILVAMMIGAHYRTATAAEAGPTVFGVQLGEPLNVPECPKDASGHYALITTNRDSVCALERTSFTRRGARTI